MVTRAWLDGLAEVANQVAVRHLLSVHHSTAALDTVLGTVRHFLDSRSFVLRNKRRTNLALGLHLSCELNPGWTGTCWTFCS